MVQGSKIVKATRRPGEPLRVVFFTASYFVLDGVTLTLRKLLAYLKSIGAEVMVVTAAPLAAAGCAELGELDGENLVLVPGMPVPVENEEYGYALGLGLTKEAKARLNEFSPHVAHFTVCDILGLDGIKWAKANDIALIGTWHSNYCEYLKFYSAVVTWWLVPVLRRYIQHFYGGLPTTYVPTDYMRQKMTLEGYHHFTDMQIWGRGIDLERFNPSLRRSEAYRAQIGVGPQDICLIWVGRLVPEKRPDIWRDVYLALLAEGFPVKGLVVGVGPCQAMFDECPGVHIAGWLSGIPLAVAYASSDLLLFPSDVETFGNVTLEALGSGIPAVVESLCSRHLVTNGIEGFTVEQGISDPQDRQAYDACVQRYLDCTRQLVADPALRKQYGQAALLKAATFSNSAVQQRMVDNYTAAYAAQVVGKEEAESVGVQKTAEEEDPNDKTFASGLRAGSTTSRRTFQAFLFHANWCCMNVARRLKAYAVNLVFQFLARVLVLIAWIVLGMPTVTRADVLAMAALLSRSVAAESDLEACQQHPQAREVAV